MITFLAKEKGSGGAMPKGLVKKLESLHFLGMRYTFRLLLPSLAALSKTFQCGIINFLKIVPKVLKIKTSATF